MRYINNFQFLAHCAVNPKNDCRNIFAQVFCVTFSPLELEKYKSLFRNKRVAVEVHADFMTRQNFFGIFKKYEN